MRLRLIAWFGSLLGLCVHPLCGAEIDDNAAAFNKLASGIIAQAVSGTINVAAVQKDVVKMEALV